jgi:hypothetical protein
MDELDETELVAFGGIQASLTELDIQRHAFWHAVKKFTKCDEMIANAMSAKIGLEPWIVESALHLANQRFRCAIRCRAERPPACTRKHARTV